MDTKTIYIILSLIIVALIGVIIYLVLKNPYPSCLGTKGKWNTSFKNDTVSNVKDFLKMMPPDPTGKIVKDTCASCLVDFMEKNYEPNVKLIKILLESSAVMFAACQNNCV